MALTANKDFMPGSFKTVSMNTVESFMAFAISGKVSKGSFLPFGSVCVNKSSKFILYGLLNFIGDKVLAPATPFLIKKS